KIHVDNRYTQRIMTNFRRTRLLYTTVALYVVICLVPMIKALRIYNFTEPSEFGPLYPINVFAYPDRTIGIRLTNRFSCPQQPTTFALRFLDPNGALNAQNLNFTFPIINFCPINRIRIFTLPDNYLLIRYWKVIDNSSIQYAGLIVSMDGEIIDPELQLSNTLSIPNTTHPNSVATLNFAQKGILYVSIYDQLSINWTRYVWDSNRGSLTQLSHDVIKSPRNFQIDDAKCFTTIDGGFGVVYSASLTPQSVTANATFPNPVTALVFMTFMRLGENNFSSTSIIYETTYPQVRISIRSCQQNHVDHPGYVCFIRVRAAANLTAGNSAWDFWRMISFFSTGTLISTLDLANNLIFDSSGIILINYTRADSLYYGGFLMTGTNQANYSQGSIYDKDGNFIQDWGIDSLNGTIFSILNNNTIFAAVPAQNNLGDSWELYSNDISPLANSTYMNPTIVSAYPPVNESIPLALKSINVTYNIEVTPSLANISIYQRTNTGLGVVDFLRQTLPASSPNVRFNDSVVSIDVLSCTFNQQGQIYFVVIDGNFAKAKEFNEPLLGVGNGTWMFRTKTGNNNSFTDDVDVIARLSSSASAFFVALSVSERHNFLNEMLISFSETIPANISRLSIMDRFQYDGESKRAQILLKMTIRSTRDLSQMNSMQIYEDMNMLVTNKSITSLMFYNSTASLDSDYGVLRLQNLWEKYRYHFAVVICVIFVSLVIVFLAHNRYPQGKSMSLFKFILVIADFVLDGIFLFDYVEDVPRLYFPYLGIILAAMSFNFFITMFIFFREFYGNTPFHQWMKKRKTIPFVFFLLGYVDLESLNLICSKVARFKIFQAPLTSTATRWIYLGSLVSVFMEDIPQLVILVRLHALKVRRITVDVEYH
ncbi:16278_t:CDS:2, partial [Acaulospora morrowiae]